ncbi:DUF5908 family protein [Aquimarina brevivitae]|uniref:Uncharacterized protein n=1 Tax=Aquimarina brevivitae TaxID=323412 RepID=A0A4Q7NYL1_9FLAO|nr:DUF5908 family protein [Aquimarina brevivitae]RZS92513.1 hypothetical protein EV197_2651 [Aquimarina brevivitae]
MGAIEIKELHIRINVDNDQEKSGAAAKPGANKDAIIAECVEQIMEIIAKQTER